MSYNKSAKLVLWFSVFIRGGDPRRSVPRRSVPPPMTPEGRLAIMLNSLKSYSGIPFDKVYLNILLEDSLSHRHGEIRSAVRSYFGDCPIDYEEDRYTLQVDLVNRFNTIKQDLDDDDVVFFTQNDDHPLIDFNNDILMEGVNHMANDSHPYKSLGLSHWPEWVRIATSKYKNRPSSNEDVQVGNFIKFNAIFGEAIQLFNVGYLTKMLCDLIPPDLSAPPYRMHRTDVITSANKSRVFEGAQGVLAHIYIPLRELCVHVDGYLQNAGIPTTIYPVLKMPLEENDFDFSREELIARMTEKGTSCNGHRSGYSDAAIPQKYIDTMLKCYGK
jgi:hypothetical protein